MSKADPLQFVAFDMRRRRGLKALLNLACQLQLVLQPFTLDTFLQQARVLDTDGGYRGQSCKYLKMVFGEPLFCNRRVRINNTEHLFADTKGNGKHGSYTLKSHRAAHKTRIVH